MKTYRPISADLLRKPSPGFALVITLSLMILLTVIAVGLLTLSSISLRASAQGNAMALARSNARLALMLAIGDLQKTAGSDQCVTARADVLEESSGNPKITGVWKSWEIKATTPPAPADFEKAARDAKFQGWLVSGTDPLVTRQIGYVSKSPASPVLLWGTGTLGDKAAANSLVSATKIPVVATPGSKAAAKPGTAANAPTGALAWAVLDEGVKVRINTRYADDATNVATKTAELGTGERAGVEFISGLNSLERKFFEKKATESAVIDKGITRLNFALAGENLAEGVREALQPLTHDVTTQSLGIFTDTARGGLKQDFQLLTNSANLPAAYQGKGVYEAPPLSMPKASVVSDPTWASLREFARLYRDKITNSGGVPLLKVQTPSGWNAATTATPPVINRTPPPGVVLLPTIAKVQVLFSLVGRDLYANLPAAPIKRQLTAAEKANGIHGPQDGQFRETKYDYDLHLMYTPVVTLHNPYNVALEFNTMRLDFVNVPFSMQIFRNGLAQSNGMVPLETMYADNDQGQQGKPFGMNLKTKVNGAPGSTTFKLMPGEVKMFSPYLDPNLTYTNRGSFWDIYVGGNLTANFDAMPGWRGDGIGYDCDWVAGGKAVDGEGPNGHWASCLGLAWDDKIHVEFMPVSLPSVTKFVVKISATTGTAATVVNAIEMDYETNNGLKDFIQSNGVAMPMRYPKATAVPNYVEGWNLVDRGATAIGSLLYVKPFALLSVQGKTTSGGRDTTMVDGRLATKPWCFAHANIGASTQKVVSEHSANFSHEIDLQLLESGSANLLSVDPQDRSNFISGHTGFNGTEFGGQYEIPLAPIQALAELNGANPGGSSGYLPRFAQPIGNSWAHPLISSNKLVETKASGNYLDHSFLLNLALYDSFYFSGLADQGGPFGSSSRTTTKLAADFAAGTALDDPRLILHPSDGKQANELAAEVAKADSYARIASWQMMEGAFNVNSTSVSAWKAMLASIHDSQAVFNQLNKTNNTSAITNLPVTVAGKKARISRFRLPASKSTADGGDSADGYWLGPREYSDAELQTLAENIVKQVRLRGPFLSLADFVNRRLGSATDAKAQRGALQQAIDDSNLNQGIANVAGQGGAGFEIPQDKVAGYKYANPAAGAGSSYQGAPGYLTQADLLNVLGNAATPRSDTFTIRGYGEARDATGQVLARATCEAVVQRYPEWLDPVDPVATAPAQLKSQANKTFGRRFLITSLRWLNPKEI